IAKEFALHKQGKINRYFIKSPIQLPPDLICRRYQFSIQHCHTIHKITQVASRRQGFAIAQCVKNIKKNIFFIIKSTNK
ncbi:TPA: hypothetical protein ACIWQ2_001293, partial [Salmonella enterica subsp. enterica serovar Typhi]